MAAPKTVLTYPLDGTNRDFPIPFEYLARKFVVVTLVGATRKVLAVTTDYRFTTRSNLTTSKAWGPGDGFETIELRRVTSATDRLVDFSDGSILRAYDLNTSQVQSLHIAEEARDLTADTIAVNNDGDLDARGRRIVNLADATEPDHAVTLRQERTWAESALNQADRAEREADTATAQRQQAETAQGGARASQDGAYLSQVAAKTSETNAKTSETNAARSAVGAKASQDGAYLSQVAALDSATSSGNSAQRSKQEADRAKQEADKLGNANAFMATIEAASPTNVTFKVGVGITASGVHVRGGGGVSASGPVYSLGGYINSQAPSAGENAHLVLSHPNGAERALLWAGTDGYLRLRSSLSAAHISISPEGAIGMANATIPNNGDMRAEWLNGGTLYNALDRTLGSRNQVWIDVTASRSGGVSYLNDTGRPIVVSVMWGQGGGGNATLHVNGVRVAFGAQNQVSGGGTMTTIVPAGATYMATFAGNSKTGWAELR